MDDGVLMVCIPLDSNVSKDGESTTRVHNISCCNNLGLGGCSGGAIWAAIVRDHVTTKAPDFNIP